MFHDEEPVARLQEDAPEVLAATMPEGAFDVTAKEPPTDGVPHFYRRECGEYRELSASLCRVAVRPRAAADGSRSSVLREQGIHIVADAVAKVVADDAYSM